MKYVVVGLGNPGEEYENSRHNTGRIVLSGAAKRLGFSPWEKNKRLNAFVSEGDIEKNSVLCILPDTFMNRSGQSVRKAVKSARAAKNLLVIYDDIDLPLGRIRIAFGRGSGGHNGVQSVIRALGTKDFIRIRVGVSPPVRGSNRPRKPKGEKKVLDFLMGNFRKPERTTVEVMTKDVTEMIEVIVTDGVSAAMNEFNGT